MKSLYIKVDSHDYKITPFASQILIEQIEPLIDSIDSLDTAFVIKTIGYFSAWKYKTLADIEYLINS